MEAGMKGYTGKILWVNLSSGIIREEVLTESIYRSFVGGAGLGARILYEHMKPKINPLGPDNILGFMTGPLTGTMVPMAAKYIVVTKSPLTNTWGDANSGGFFGSELKAAGYDAVFFTGVSAKPVYLFINDGKAELKDGTSLWGKDTQTTEKMLYEDTGEKGLKFACIGPSGESLSLISSIIADRGRVAARSGVGAVMGSKKLKAIAVKGKSKIEVADLNEMNRLRHEMLKYLHDEQGKLPFIKMLSNHGTCDGPLNLMLAGAAPVKNWSLNGVDAFPDYKDIAGDRIIQYQIRKSGCGNCPINCGGILRIEEGSYSLETRKPEYETLAALGIMCLNKNAESIIKANDICDRYGLDTISTGSVIAFAMECYEKGIISSKDTDGIELTWGNGPATVAMVEKIAKREGFGDILADGVKRAAERIGKGAETCSMEVHGQEPGMHDPRFNPHRGLGYMIGATPGRHMLSMAAIRLSGEGKLGAHPELQAPAGSNEEDTMGKRHALGASYSQVFSDSGMCLYALTTGVAFPLSEFIRATTGWDFTVSEAITAGKRTLALLQMFNLREGWEVENSKLPYRLAMPPSTGPFAGRNINFDGLKASYYRNMNWDTGSGIPSRDCIRELDLAGVASSSAGNLHQE
jgi:aldehyde:ferredoxin oxidoreductase